MAENINISPDMINNLVNMLKNSNTASSQSEVSENNNETNSDSSGESRGIFSNFSSSGSSNSSTSNLDFDTIMKIKSIMEALNKKDDPKSNLLYSLKPYLRKSKQAKLDQYVNILKISQVTGLFNQKKGDSN